MIIFVPFFQPYVTGYIFMHQIIFAYHYNKFLTMLWPMNEKKKRPIQRFTNRHRIHPKSKANPIIILYRKIVEAKIYEYLFYVLNESSNILCVYIIWKLIRLWCSPTPIDSKKIKPFHNTNFSVIFHNTFNIQIKFFRREIIVLFVHNIVLPKQTSKKVEKKRKLKG